MPRSDGVISDEAWLFIITALRGIRRPDQHSVIRRAVALAHEREWIIPHDKAISNMLREYRTSLASRTSCAELYKFPIC